MTALVGRIGDRVRRYVGRLRIGEPVRFSEVMWAIMNEPGVVDARELRLVRYPPQLSAGHVTGALAWAAEEAAVGQDVQIGPTQVAVLVTDPADVQVA